MKTFVKDEHYGHSTLLLEPVSEVEKKILPSDIFRQVFLNAILLKSIVKIAYLKN